MAATPTVCLPARQLFEITDASAVRILCTAGSLWLTLDHDIRDVILEPGDSFEAAQPRRALLYAFEASAFALAAKNPVSQRGAVHDSSRGRPSQGVWAAAPARSG